MKQGGLILPIPSSTQGHIHRSRQKSHIGQMEFRIHSDGIPVSRAVFVDATQQPSIFHVRPVTVEACVFHSQPSWQSDRYASTTTTTAMVQNQQFMHQSKAFAAKRPVDYHTFVSVHECLQMCATTNMQTTQP